MKRTGLSRNPQSLRDWQQRSRETAAANAREKPRKPLAPISAGKKEAKAAQRAVEGPLSPPEWRREVWRLDGGRSVLSGERVDQEASSWVWQAHHGVPKRVLRDRGLFHVVYDPRNGMVLLAREHGRHEHRWVDGAGHSHVVPWEKVPARVKAFARELGQWAEDELRRNHPSADELRARRPGGRDDG